MAKSPTEDIKEKAAKSWQKSHGYKTLHEAYTDKQFRKEFDRLLKNSSAANRKRLGLTAKTTEQERIQLRILRSMKGFGNTP